MRKLWQQVCGVIVRPRATLEQIGQRPRVKPVLLLLLALSASQILFLDYYLEDATIEGRWVVVVMLALVAFAFLLALGSELIIAALTVLATRAVRLRVGWRNVFCLYCFAGIPSWVISFLSIPLSEHSWEGRWISLGLDTTGLFWSMALTFLALRTIPGASARKALAGTVPSFVIWGSLMLWVAMEDRVSLRNAERWQRVDGETVELYLSREQAISSGLAEECDRVLRRVCEFWNVSVPDRRTRIFLFPSEESHERFARDETTAAAAFPKRMSISLVAGGWQEIAGAIAHELSHVVVHHRIARDLPALLDEGMAVLAEQEFVVREDLPAVSNPPHLSPGLSLLELADSEFFYDKAVETLWLHYRHAGAFVRDLISAHGLARFKGFCQNVADRRLREWILGDETLQLSEAFHDTYGVPLDEWESAWKQNPPATNRNAPTGVETRVAQ